MDTSTYILIGVFCGLPMMIGVISGIVKMAGGKQRAKEMPQLAASMNLSFHVKGDDALVSSLTRLPSFTLTPQGWLHNIAVSLGAPDINFDSHPTFSRQSLLFGADEEAIRRAFTGEVLEFDEHRGQWSTAGDGTRFLVYKSSKRLPPGGSRFSSLRDSNS